MKTNIRAAQDRFYHHKYGVFNHYLFHIQNNPKTPNSYGKETSWEETVEEFDTDLLARNLHEIGAGYYVITVMQGSKYMIAPNAAYDKIAGTRPGEACSKRDLIEDLYHSLKKYGIDLFLYFTGDGPWKDEAISKRFGFTAPRSQGVSKEFVLKWGSVLKEYALRYQDKIAGWWIDGCYYDFFRYTDDLLDIYYHICKEGNPDTLVGLNDGVAESGIKLGYPKEDYLCGECTDFIELPAQRFYHNAQAHILASLGTGDNGIGPGWGSFGTKIDKEVLADYIRNANAAGAVVTIDIGVYRDGAFDISQMAVLKYVKEKIKPDNE